MQSTFEKLTVTKANNMQDTIQPVETFHVGDTIYVFNCLTKQVGYKATILAFQEKGFDGQPFATISPENSDVNWGNTLRTATKV